jgi:hypothetical protein
VVEAGLSVCAAPLNPPGFHEYVVAPVAVMSVDVEEQIDALFAETVGVVVTLSATVAVPLHPSALPVTV